MARVNGALLCLLARILAYLAITSIVTSNAASIFNITNSHGVPTMWIVFTKNECGYGLYKPTNGITCTPCLNYGEEQCDLSNPESCCQHLNLQCKQQDNNVSRCQCTEDAYFDNNGCITVTSVSNNEFMTAAQVALGAALVIAVSALSALTCKMCSSRRRFAEARALESDTTSLNSVQRFVLSRLRDRPPRYDDTNSMPDKPPPYSEIETPAESLPSPSTTQTNLHRLLRANRRPPNPPGYANQEGNASSSVASFPEPQPSTSGTCNSVTTSTTENSGTVNQNNSVENEKKLDDEMAMNSEVATDTNNVSDTDTLRLENNEEASGGIDNPAFSIDIRDNAS